MMLFGLIDIVRIVFSYNPYYTGITTGCKDNLTDFC